MLEPRNCRAALWLHTRKLVRRSHRVGLHNRSHTHNRATHKPGPMRRPLKAPKRLFQERELYSSLISLVVLRCAKSLCPGVQRAREVVSSGDIDLWLENHPGGYTVVRRFM